MRFVIDASVTLSWLFNDEGGPSDLQVLESLTSEEAIVPAIWTLEVANVLAVAKRNNRITQIVADQFLHLLQQLPITVDVNSVKEIPVHVLRYAREYHLSVYDASYLELAIREGVPLATHDQALIEAMCQVGVPCFPYPDTSDAVVHETTVQYT
jgi:predicted nucleic acid-binding protein